MAEKPVSGHKQLYCQFNRVYKHPEPIINDFLLKFHLNSIIRDHAVLITFDYSLVRLETV